MKEVFKTANLLIIIQHKMVEEFIIQIHNNFLKFNRYKLFLVYFKLTKLKDLEVASTFKDKIIKLIIKRHYP